MINTPSNAHAPLTLASAKVADAMTIGRHQLHARHAAARRSRGSWRRTGCTPSSSTTTGDEDDEDLELWGLVSDLDVVAGSLGRHRRADGRRQRRRATRDGSQRRPARACGSAHGRARRLASRGHGRGLRPPGRRALLARHRARDRRCSARRPSAGVPTRRSRTSSAEEPPGRPALAGRVRRVEQAVRRPALRARSRRRRAASASAR